MKQRQRYQRQGTPQRITKAVTHIRLLEVNPGKLAALDALAPVYLALCQEYVTFFCTEVLPDKFHAPFLSAPLSERWHRVAIQQAAGIAQVRDEATDSTRRVVRHDEKCCSCHEPPALNAGGLQQPERVL